MSGNRIARAKTIDELGRLPSPQTPYVAQLKSAPNGRLDAIERCRAAYEAYVTDPTEASREEALRVAYEVE